MSYAERDRLRTQPLPGDQPMPEYDNELRGVLFKNDKKESGDKRPNAKGECQISGVRYWVSAWTRTRPNGEPMQSLQFERAEDRHQPSTGTGSGNVPAETTNPVTTNPVADDEIPF